MHFRANQNLKRVLTTLFGGCADATVAPPSPYLDQVTPGSTAAAVLAGPLVGGTDPSVVQNAVSQLSAAHSKTKNMNRVRGDPYLLSCQLPPVPSGVRVRLTVW